MYIDTDNVKEMNSNDVLEYINSLNDKVFTFIISKRDKCKLNALYGVCGDFPKESDCGKENVK